MNMLIWICIEPNCQIVANFGPPGTKIRKFCGQQTPWIYCDNSRSCIELNCLIEANFGQMGTKKPTYCRLRKPDGYVNV